MTYGRYLLKLRKLFFVKWDNYRTYWATLQPCRGRWSCWSVVPWSQELDDLFERRSHSTRVHCHTGDQDTEKHTDLLLQTLTDKTKCRYAGTYVDITTLHEWHVYQLASSSAGAEHRLVARRSRGPSCGSGHNAATPTPANFGGLSSTGFYQSEEEDVRHSLDLEHWLRRWLLNGTKGPTRPNWSDRNPSFNFIYKIEKFF